MDRTRPLHSGAQSVSFRRAGAHSNGPSRDGQGAQEPRGDWPDSSEMTWEACQAIGSQRRLRTGKRARARLRTPTGWQATQDFKVPDKECKRGLFT